LVGVGTDGLNNFLAAWSGLNLTATRSCGTGLCAPGRLDFNNNPVTSVTFNGQLGYWNYMNDSLTLPNFSFGAGAIDRGLWVDSVATRLFYTQNNLLGVYDSRTNTGLLWNPYCIANSDFCAAVATAAKDLGKGNSNGVNWFNTVDGTSYLTRNNAGSSTVPEPRTYLLFGTGLFLMGLVNQIRNHKRV